MSNKLVFEDQLKAVIKELRTAICIHVREEGQYLEYLGDGISTDQKAVKAFIEYYDPKSWD